MPPVPTTPATSNASGAVANRNAVFSPPLHIPFPGMWDPKPGEEIQFINVQAVEQARLMRYEERWSFYEGKHWTQMMQVREGAEEPPITLNYVRTFLNKHNVMLMGEPPKFIPRHNSDEAMKKRVQFLNDVWEANDREVISMNIGQSVGVAGDAFLYFAFVPDPLSEWGVRINIEIIPARYCFPRYLGTQLVGMLVLFPSQDSLGIDAQTQQASLSGDGIYYTLDYSIEIKNGKFTNTVRRNHLNPLIPFVHIRNIALAIDAYGISEIDDFLHINRALNEAHTNIADIIAYHAAPVTLVFGHTVDQLEKGHTKIWSGMDKDARIENLRLDGDLTASNAHVEHLTRAMMDTGHIPEHTLSKTLAMSNTSGAAISLLWWPLIERRDLRRVFIGSGLRQANVIILRLAELWGMIPTVRAREAFNFPIKWGEKIPRSRGHLLDEQRTMWDLNIGERMDFLIELGLSEDEARTKLERIDKERMELIAKGLIEPPKTAESAESSQSPSSQPREAAGSESSRQGERAAALAG